jgi:Ca-activated chloride channel family protein
MDASRAALALGIALAVRGALAMGAAQPPALSITAPKEDVFLSGPTKLAAEVSAGVAVQSVRFFVDGRLACTVERPPFGCVFDPGPIVRGHHVRVVATLADGSRLVANVRTKDLGYTEKAHVEAVLVPVVVSEGGRFVGGLQRQDFEVLEDGVPQRIVAFANEDSPLDLVLAIDISGSMEHALGRVKEAVKQLLGRLRPTDAVTVIGFNDTMFIAAEREQDQRAREDAVDQLTAWGGTALYDATVRAVDLVGSSTARKGVVVFSDGDDRHSLTGPDAAAARVQAGNAMLYTVGFGGGATVPTLREHLEHFAQSTGGRAFFPRDTNELEPVFGHIVTELSNQYVLSYVSTNTRADGAWRSIRVRVRQGKYEVRARRGYQTTVRRVEEDKP